MLMFCLPKICDSGNSEGSLDLYAHPRIVCSLMIPAAHKFPLHLSGNVPRRGATTNWICFSQQMQQNLVETLS